MRRGLGRGLGRAVALALATLLSFVARARTLQDVLHEELDRVSAHRDYALPASLDLAHVRPRNLEQISLFTQLIHYAHDYLRELKPDHVRRLLDICLEARELSPAVDVLANAESLLFRNLTVDGFDEFADLLEIVVQYRYVEQARVVYDLEQLGLLSVQRFRALAAIHDRFVLLSLLHLSYQKPDEVASLLHLIDHAGMLDPDRIERLRGMTPAGLPPTTADIDRVLGEPTLCASHLRGTRRRRSGTY